jgi:hypothetical protein
VVELALMALDHRGVFVVRHLADRLLRWPAYNNLNAGARAPAAVRLPVGVRLLCPKRKALQGALGHHSDDQGS